MRPRATFNNRGFCYYVTKGEERTDDGEARSSSAQRRKSTLPALPNLGYMTHCYQAREKPKPGSSS